ncbi:MAG: amidohydrolase family protein [Mogibacterium sp.]|nr:amidohydrolase family protein [Mogibacterium sp.]
MKYALINGILLDGTKDMEPVPGQVILINGSRIVDIRPAGVSTDGYEVIDLNGAYVMPGLINLHVHIPGSGKPKKKPTDAVKLVRLLTSNALLKRICYNMCAGYTLAGLWSGVTTIRSVGGVQDIDSRLRDEILAGKRVGPRILAGNMAVSVPGGHMAGSLAYEAHSKEEAVEFVRKIAAEGPDLIKLMITGGVFDATKKGEPGELKMPAEYVKAACDEAHRLGLPVAAHVESPEGVKIALQNGVDTIEHGAKPDEEIIALFKERGAAHIATISPTLPYAFFDLDLIGIDEVTQYNGKVVFDGVIGCAKACLEAGVPVGLGTDTGCPYTTHYDMWRELCYFHKYCGVSNAFALYSATLGNAKIVGLDKEIGSLAPGKCADIITCKENPLEDLEALRNVSMVMARGEIVDISKLKKYPACDRELDKFL